MPDAIKKIILESEKGRFAKFAAVQNRKLRREVTTISRMTHKNIVRYYQAWVEGEEVDTINENDVIDEEDNSTGDDVADAEEILKGEDSASENDDGGWWTNSPTELHLPQHLQGASGSSTSDSQSASWSTSTAEGNEHPSTNSNHKKSVNPDLDISLQGNGAGGEFNVSAVQIVGGNLFKLNSVVFRVLCFLVWPLAKPLIAAYSSKTKLLRLRLSTKIRSGRKTPLSKLTQQKNRASSIFRYVINAQGCLDFQQFTDRWIDGILCYYFAETD